VDQSPDFTARQLTYRNAEAPDVALEAVA
jgi:hypothetical protein